jgi:hypothetical protein
MTREEYWDYSHSPSVAYFAAPPYEKYLQLYNKYSETSRERLYPLDEASFKTLGVHDDLRGAFTHGRPLTRDEYEITYASIDQVLPEGVTPYDDYARNWYYGEMGVGPPSREEYTKRYVFVAPPYEEYLQLYKKYSAAYNKRK